MLDRFAEWMGEEGLVVLAVPNLRSVRGLLARLRGRPGCASRSRRGRCGAGFAEHGFMPVFQCFYEDANQAAWRRRLRITQGRWTLVAGSRTDPHPRPPRRRPHDYIVVFRAGIAA